ncbi:MAG: GldG family protein, partial [Treponema sp.]|nr:GldG family protein [Treponema sp.]
NEIPELVRITYYCSGKLGTLYPDPGEISDLLREYAARSRGKILVTFRDPSGAFAEDTERFGLMPQSLPNVGSDELSLSTVYSGIVIEYLNKVEVISWVFGLETLEYDITSRIRSLVSGKKRELGILAPDPQKDLSEYYGFLNETLVRSGFSVLPLYPGDEISDTLPALFVLGGAESLDEYSLYRIDRYVQLGGRVLFAVESVDVDFSYTWDARLSEDKGLLAMVSFYGATVGQSIVLDPASLTLPYRDSSGQLMLARYPPWIGVGEENGDSILTSNFAGVDLFWASPLSLTLPESGKVRGEVLFSSSPGAWLMTKNFAIRPETSYLFTAEEEETRGSKILAVSLEGIFPSWFEGVDKPEEDGRPALPDMPAGAKESRIMVVGDSDLAGIIVQYTQSQRNLDFMRRTADWLCSDDDIAEIGNRQSGTGRLDRITDPIEKLSAMRFARILNVALIPLGIVFFGIVRALKRRPGKEQHDA